MSEPAGSGAAKAPTTDAAKAVPDSSAPAAQKAAEGESEAKKLSPAELKKQKQAEKQARRAQQKSTGPPQNAQKGAPGKEASKPQKDSKQAAKDDKALPIRGGRRPSQPAIQVPKELKKEHKPKSAKKQPFLFGHLMSQPRVNSIVGASKDVHPAICALGLQYSSYTICGSTARMVAMLLAFKAVIQSYQTPHGTSLARHLTAHHLSPQIDFLRSCRPLSISMGNAIRWLKEVVIKVDPSLAEQEAKNYILTEIDEFIRDRVTAADQLITDYGHKKIENGDVVLTYASSSIVEKNIVRALREGTKFSVIVVDSKPLFEGKQLARKLASHGISVKYMLISGASHAIKQATKVFLGAHAMMSNGRLYSRVGTALVAMLAHAQSIPVIVLCESVKFTERVALDSIVGNEVAPPEEMLSEGERESLATLKRYLPQGVLTKLGENTDEEEKKTNPGDVLKWIEGSDNLQMLQVLYDVTPAEYINMVITEWGTLPPTSVPVVHRSAQEKR